MPISHSINFYNKLLTDAQEKDKSRYVSEEDATILLETQTFPTQKPPKIFEKIRLTIFEGTHEILKSAALDAIEAR